MFSILSAGIAPTFALMAFFYLKDRFSEPIGLTLKMFILGALLVFPIMFIQYTFAAEGFSNNAFIYSFLVVALSEEFFKWFIFLYFIYHHTEFDEHYDGIVYAVAISLGFATIENFLYILTNGVEYAFTRALFPVSSHALFGVIMGFYFGKSKVGVQLKKWNLFLAFSLPYVLHGLYDYILLTVTSRWLLLLIPFMIALWLLGLRSVKVANQSIDPIFAENKKQA
ncbi:glutamic-type intramembrane protease PrsW [Oceanobacillus halotolerans]|uniref:glutamic-type intramembrane protease PrsW n=1 Tax=Oceanobacillus halotolerans TaxID=2663380 RepID=UPI0013DB4EB5|nr:glutamic-type intramembrane protease PrsW [Oceanobacillus halotolerans]